MPVVSVSDLILLKLFAGGHQDRWDIEALLVDAPGAVRDEVDARIGMLPGDSQRLWAEMRQRNGGPSA